MGLDIVRSAQINSSPETVWTLLADFGAISRWAPNVDHSSLMSDQSSGLGAVRRIQAGRATLLERIVHWEPNDSLAYVIEGLPPVVSEVRNRWDITPVGNASNVSLTTTVVSGPRPPQALVGRAVGRRLGQASEQMLSGMAIFLAGSVWVGGRSS